MKEETEKETNEFDIAELFGAIPADGIRIAVSGMRRADGGCKEISQLVPRMSGVRHGFRRLFGIKSRWLSKPTGGGRCFPDGLRVQDQKLEPGAPTFNIWRIDYEV